MPRARYLYALMLTLLAYGCVSLVPYEPTVYDKDQRIARITWEAACRLSQYDDCPGDGPSARRSPIVGEMANAYGLYWMGAPVIWIDSDLMGTQLWLTIFHEQIHYLQSWNDVHEVGDESRLTVCMLEREAMELTNRFAAELNAEPKYTRSAATWRRLYGCTASSFRDDHEEDFLWVD